MRIRTILAVVAVLALIAAACGGDGGEAETTTTAAANQQTTTTTAAETTTTTTVPEETTTTTASGTGGSAAALAGLRESLTKSSETTSGRMAGLMTIAGIPDLPGGAFEIPFSGAFDNESGNFSFLMDMSGLASIGGDEIPPEFADMFGEMEVRTIGDTSYIRFPFFALFLGAQTEWISAPAEEGLDASGGFAGGATPGNPADFLDAFDDANGTAEEVGRETIRGVDTTHYLVVFDMEELLENATPEERSQIEAQGPLPIDELPMDLWISDDGLVYKYVIELVGSDLDLPADESFESMTMEFEMFDYGEDIVIEPPPADEVTEMENLDFLNFEGL